MSDESRSMWFWRDVCVGFRLGFPSSSLVLFFACCILRRQWPNGSPISLPIRRMKPKGFFFSRNMMRSYRCFFLVNLINFIAFASKLRTTRTQKPGRKAPTPSNPYLPTPIGHGLSPIPTQKAGTNQPTDRPTAQAFILCSPNNLKKFPTRQNFEYPSIQRQTD